jgi:RNA polymerase-binding transcription factor DksA
MRTHTYQDGLAGPVPDSTPPEHRPDTEAAPAEWDGLRTAAGGRSTPVDVAPLDAFLAELERTRAEQLAALDADASDLVAVAYRSSVSRILGEIRTARQRLRDGKHGVCVDCHGTIAADRVEAVPWATQCTHCARLRYS